MIDDIIYKIEKKSKTTKNLVKDVEILISKIKDIVEVSDQIYYNIIVAVTEGINNAINHGNKSDKEKDIKIDIYLNKNAFAIQIEDQGEGFEIENVKDPRNHENLLKDNGRGVFLMKELSNDFQISSSVSGTVVKMIFNLK